MGLMVPWREQYLIAQSSTISEAIDFSAGSIGIEADKYVLPLTSYPHLTSGQNIISTEKSLGVAMRRMGVGYEYQAGTRLPLITLDAIDATPYLASLFLWLLLQNGASEGISPNYQKIYIPWSNASPEIYCNIARIMSDSSGDSFRIRGGVCRSLRFSGREGEVIKLSAEIIGAYIDNDFVASSAVFNWSERAPFLFNDLYNVSFYGGKSIRYSISEFDITINNNIIAKPYNSQVPSKFILGKLTASASGTFKWNVPESSAGGQHLFDEFKQGSMQSFTLEFARFLLSISGILTSVEVIDEEQSLIKFNMEGATRTGPGECDADQAVYMEIIDEQQRGIT